MSCRRSRGEFWPLLQPASRLGFVLYGGTAIAVRLGHRVSVDFDFFASQPLEEARVRAALPFMATTTVLQAEPDTLTVMAPVEGAAGASVKLSFLGGIGFGRVGAPDLTGDGVARVASLDDLLATKLKVMLQRVEAKDYSDVAAMLGAGVRLAAALAAARLLYGGAFQHSESLRRWSISKAVTSRPCPIASGAGSWGPSVTFRICRRSRWLRQR